MDTWNGFFPFGEHRGGNSRNRSICSGREALCHEYRARRVAMQEIKSSAIPPDGSGIVIETVDCIVLCRTNGPLPDAPASIITLKGAPAIPKFSPGAGSLTKKSV